MFCIFVDNIRLSFFVSSRGSSVDDVCFSSIGILVLFCLRIILLVLSVVFFVLFDVVLLLVVVVFVIFCVGDGVRWLFVELVFLVFNGGVEGVGVFLGVFVVLCVV